MKILCVSDHKDPIIYSSQLKVRLPDVDLVLAAGDLELEYYGFIVSSLNKPLLFVFGNHNLSRIADYRKRMRDPLGSRQQNIYFKPTFGSTYVGGRVRRIKGLTVAGLGGSKRYNKGLNQHSEFGMFRQILRLVPRLLVNRVLHGRYLDILLTHAAPRGIGDLPDPCHEGFKVFRWFIRVFRPRYHIHGHVHLYDLNARREWVYYGTKVINAYNHVLIETHDHDIRPEHEPNTGTRGLQQG